MVTDILRCDDSSDSTKPARAETLGEYYSLFDGAFGDEPRRSSDDLLQELEQLLEGATS